MTIDEAIHLADELAPNSLPRSRKIEWLDRLDEWVYNTIIEKHEDPDAPDFAGYTEETDPDTELLIGGSHDEVYRFYLQMHIFLALQEYEAYNQMAALYANARMEYAREYHRDHRPRAGRGNYHQF